MPYNRYQRSKEMLSTIPKGTNLGMVRLRSLIMMNAGAQERTIRDYIKLMLSTRLLKDIGDSHFEVQ